MRPNRQNQKSEKEAPGVWPINTFSRNQQSPDFKRDFDFGRDIGRGFGRDIGHHFGGHTLRTFGRVLCPPRYFRTLHLLPPLTEARPLGYLGMPMQCVQSAELFSVLSIRSHWATISNPVKHQRSAIFTPREKRDIRLALSF